MATITSGTKASGLPPLAPGQDGLLGTASHAATWFLWGERINRGLTMRFQKQLISAVVMTWFPEAPPANWMQLGDDGWRLHVIRMAAGMGGLSLLMAATLKLG